MLLKFFFFNLSVKFAKVGNDRPTSSPSSASCGNYQFYPLCYLRPVFAGWVLLKKNKEYFNQDSGLCRIHSDQRDLNPLTVEGIQLWDHLAPSALASMIFNAVILGFSISAFFSIFSLFYTYVVDKSARPHAEKITLFWIAFCTTIKFSLGITVFYSILVLPILDIFWWPERFRQYWRGLPSLTLTGTWLAWYHGLAALEYSMWVNWWNTQILDYYNRVKNRSPHLDYEARLLQYIRCMFLFTFNSILHFPAVIVLLCYSITLNQGWSAYTYKRRLRKDRHDWVIAAARFLKLPLTKEERFWASIRSTYNEVYRNRLIRERHELRRRRRYSRWLGVRPDYSYVELRKMTLKRDKTVGEINKVIQEWAWYKRRLKYRQDAKKRYLIRRKRRPIRLNAARKYWSRIREKGYEKAKSSGKRLTYKQYLVHIKTEMDQRWELEQYSVSWRKLLPSEQEISYIRHLTSRALLLKRPRRYFLRFWRFLDRREDDYYDFWTIYWDYTDRFSRVFFSTNKIFLFFGKYYRRFKSRIKYSLAWTKKKTYPIYYFNFKQPIIKKLIILKKNVFTSAPINYMLSLFNSFKVHFQPFSQLLYKYLIFPFYKYVLRSAYSRVFVPIYKEIIKSMKKTYKSMGGSYVNKYFSRRVWNESSWKRRWLKRVRKEARYSNWKYRHHRRFDKFMKNLGWFRYLLPTNILRKLYIKNKEYLGRRKRWQAKLKKNKMLIAQRLKELKDPKRIKKEAYWARFEKELLRYEKSEVRKRKLKAIKKRNARVSDARKKQQKERPGGDEEGTWWF